MKYVIKPLSLLTLLGVLAGCNADKLEVTLKTDEIRAVGQGELSTISFEAEFSLMSELDAEQRAELDQIIATVEDFMDIDDIELENTDMGINLLIEGQMPMSGTQVSAPWYVSVTDSYVHDDLYRIELANGNEFDRFQNALQGINFMLAPNAVQPVKYKVRGEGLVMAPGVDIDGYTYLLYAGEIDRRLTMNFSGGPWENTSGGFFLNK
ncbi:MULTISPECIES: hypothetical protein [unclassified Marinobacterium]|jgi:hypothetical protein|uniref:hypothetical protein n=1 Tax=unclassified Marinobacterium TaxID=2644139 RepID=UPI001567DA58|nr:MULTISPECIES: hypothetical protein [unclassified Marinobacterium]CAI8214747.1 MAG: Uncharacterised protein [Marinobacterium sp. xm-d-530]NRP37431.1 hypothetical protein [Marinobacterium sp. xm-a-121]NRP58367.1 hypothetical protein [Marinobacterium sp. xm-d-510]NRP60364.1 hypothetical protein [Marinobacterium sp. xm-d-564]NRP98516.1 hypothetical protein [Marinobacterium sp. xm-a-127]